MSKTWLRGTAAVIAVSIVGCTSAVAGGVVCAVVDPIWQAGHASAETTLNAAVNTMVSTFATNSALTTSQIVSALKVLTKQGSTEAQQKSIGTQQALKAAAETYVEQRKAEEVNSAYNTYGPPGQAVGSCDVVQNLGTMQSALAAVDERASEIVQGGGIDARPGSTISIADAIKKRSLVAASGFVGATSAEAFLDPATSAAAKDTYMNNVIGMPLEKPAGINGTSDGIMMMRARRAEAMRSPAIASLAAVRAATEDTGHFDVDEGGGDNRSVQKVIDWLLDRYGGGAEYETWSAGLVTKSSTGLMKELARLYTIRLALQNEVGQSQDRRQVVLGALLAGGVSE